MVRTDSGGHTVDRSREIEFMARFCARCDLVAIQEVMDDLEGLEELRRRTNEFVAGDGEYGLIVSNITGRVPGETGMAERLAFLYRRHRIRRLHMASDLTIDLSGVKTRLVRHGAKMIAAWKKYDAGMKAYEEAKRRYDKARARGTSGLGKPKKPKFKLPAFLTFTRTPFVVAFEAPAAGGRPPLRFIAVNAHLVFGTMTERKREFRELVTWMTERLRARDKMVAGNFVLMGDLNLDFNKPEADRKRIEKFIRERNQKAFSGEERIFFPFIDRHPPTGKIWRTNARESQTFDHIAFFRGADEARLPTPAWRTRVRANDPDGFDFRVFEFVELFAETLEKKPFGKLTEARREALLDKCQHTVSDHMPIWVRLPRPGFRD